MPIGSKEWTLAASLARHSGRGCVFALKLAPVTLCAWLAGHPIGCRLAARTRERGREGTR